MSSDTTPTAEGSYEWYRHEVARLNERVEYLSGRVADLQEYEVGIKHLTTEDGSINMSLALAHDQMRIFVAAFQKVLDEQGGPNYVEMDFKLAGTLDRYTVTIKRPKGKTPADVASEQRVRAAKAETELAEARAAIERVKEIRDRWYQQPGMSEEADTLDAALDAPQRPEDTPNGSGRSAGSTPANSNSTGTPATPHTSEDAQTGVSTPTEASGGTGQAQEGSR